MLLKELGVAVSPILLVKVLRWRTDSSAVSQLQMMSTRGIKYAEAYLIQFVAFGTDPKWLFLAMNKSAADEAARHLVQWLE